MPERPPRPCLKSGCPNLVKNGRCPTHEAQKARAINADRGSAASRGYGPDWRRLRDDVLSREPLCRACAVEGIVRPADSVDHVIPKSRGGTNDLSNLQPLCTPHNSAKGDREVRYGPASPDPLAVEGDGGAA